MVGQPDHGPDHDGAVAARPTLRAVLVLGYLAFIASQYVVSTMTTVLIIHRQPDEALEVLALFQDRCRILVMSGMEAVRHALETEHPDAVLYKGGVRGGDSPRTSGCPISRTASNGCMWRGQAMSICSLDWPEVMVTNSAGLLSPFLAETVIGALAAMNSGLMSYRLDQLENAECRPFKPLREQTPLIVGLGHIGGYVADYARPWGCGRSGCCPPCRARA